MRKPSVQDLIYHKTYPRPRPNDPVSFLIHIQRCLVPEVREEVQRYFGRIDCLEAQYPGLDYTFAPHRRRLASFPWHRRLFRAFEELGLTKNEILSMCTWEGTKAAKERFERDSRSNIECTTLSGVVAAPEGCGPAALFHTKEQYATRSDAVQAAYVMNDQLRADSIDEELEDDEEFDETVGFQLNEQLRAAAAARDRGELALFDEQWEQWMKEALERNELDLDTILATLRQGRPFPALSEEGESSRPDMRLIQNGIAENTAELNGEDTPTEESSSPSLEPTAQTFDELHNMLDELQTNNNRLAADNAAMAQFLSRTRTETAR